jgi:hypothetical protein
VSKQYVDAAVANRAVDAVVVHLAGAEVIQGAKQFAAPPAVPAPSGADDAVNKAYVDAAVSNVGAGNYVAKSGDAMTGPLTLAGDPTALNHAANRHYVDTGLAGKANLVNGVVPTGQLGSGVADGTLCLKGNSSWGSCGSGGGGEVSSVFGRTGAVVAASGDYTVSQVTGAAADSAVVHNTGAETIGGAKTFSNDVTLSGNLNVAGNIVQTGAGPWSAEGAYGTMTAAAAGKSKIGFSSNGKLAVSENAGAVTEVAKNYPQEFTYTFFDANNLLTTSLQVPSIYVNRAAAFHIVEVYCEIDAGNMTINLQNGGANVLSSDLACTTAGATSSSFVAGKDAVATAAKIGHVTVSAAGNVHRMNVVVKYTVD